MLEEGIIKGRAVIDDDVVVGETCFGIVPTIFGTEDPNLVTDPLEFYISFMYQSFIGHRQTHIAQAVRSKKSRIQC